MKRIRLMIFFMVVLLSPQAYAVVLHGGKADKSGNGSYYQWDDADAIRGLVFDANQDFTLKSVKVYNQKGQAATRVFTLYNALGDVVHSKSVYVKEGAQRIKLNMHVPKGKGYKLMADIHKGLYKNNVANYPYKIGDVVTITGSDIDRKHYYFFYDWKINTKKDNLNILHGGKADKSGSGSYYQWDDADAIRGLVFDANQDFTLKSVKVYNQQGQAATRVFTLYDASGDVVASESVDVKEGEQRIALNMRVPKGKGYKLMADIHKGLYKNNVANYPYKIGNVVTITGSDIDRKHYYFFYDWEVKVENIEPEPIPEITKRGYYPSKKELNYSNIVYAGPNNYCSIINSAPQKTTVVLQDGEYSNACILADVHHVTIKAAHNGKVRYNNSDYFFSLNHSSYINIIGMDVQGGYGNSNSGIAKIFGYSKHSISHHVYIAHNTIHDAGNAVYTSPASHDISVDHNVIRNIGPSYAWYMLGYHLSFTNNVVSKVYNNYIAIRGYWPLNADHPWYGTENLDWRGEGWQRLASDDWTHYVASNDFGDGVAGGVNRSGNRGAAIGFFIGWASGVESENSYQPPQNVVIEDNHFHNLTSDRGILGSITIVSEYGFPAGADGHTYYYDQDGERFAVIRGTVIRHNISDEPLFRLEPGDNPNMGLITVHNNQIK